MTFDGGPCSDAMGSVKKHSVKLLCQWTKTMATDISRNDSQVILKVLYI
jgi:hypothetical protein